MTGLGARYRKRSKEIGDDKTYSRLFGEEILITADGISDVFL